MVAVLERSRIQQKEYITPILPPPPALLSQTKVLTMIQTAEPATREASSLSTKEQVAALWAELRYGQIAFAKLRKTQSQTPPESHQRPFIDELVQQHRARMNSDRVAPKDRKLEAGDTPEALAAAVRRGSDVFELLLKQYDPLTKYVMGRMFLYFGALTSPEDYLQEGRIGLIQAVKRFDPSFGVKFETYAISRIRGAMLDAERLLNPLPRSLRERMALVERKTAEFIEENGRKPNREELLHKCQLEDPFLDTLGKLSAVMYGLAFSTVSLDTPVSSEDDDPGNPQLLGDYIAADDEYETARAVETREKIKALHSAIAALPPRLQVLLHFYHDRELTMLEIAQLFGVSGSRVRQLHQKALEKLKAHMEKYDYEPPSLPPPFIPRTQVLFEMPKTNGRAEANGVLVTHPGVSEVKAIEKPKRTMGY